eukprot:TRINITY_DN15051_c0_g1_i1.p1 TRINITY_DN15051_c0_g1~~TRINITY_DN15051_c0_g1_i1.p1  ORF type:complete len:534 (-),score=113.67 TRINITY_DN15051_c0_g1_i1:206-1807(-)
MGNSHGAASETKKKHRKKGNGHLNETVPKKKQIQEESTVPSVNVFEYDCKDDVSESNNEEGDEENLFSFTEKEDKSPTKSHNQSFEDDKKIIQWQKGAVIGQGSFGKVYLGLNSLTGELLAIKQINLEDEQNPEKEFGDTREVQALEREIAILRNLRHPNVVRYYGTSCGNNKLNIFLEYVSGGSIFSLLQKFGQFPEEVIAVYTRQILTGLEYLHSHQIIHRDIKGGNVLVDHSGVIKLADFGASKKLEGIISGKNSAENSLKGTVYWMAPEVIKQQQYGSQADIWSVGCTVIEMATGKPPWADIYKDQVSAMYNIAASNQIPPLPPHLSSAAKKFLTSCLMRDFQKRPSASVLLREAELVVNISNTTRLTDTSAQKKVARSFQYPKDISTTKKTKAYSEPGIQNRPSLNTPSNQVYTPQTTRSNRTEPTNPFQYLRNKPPPSNNYNANNHNNNYNEQPYFSRAEVYRPDNRYSPQEHITDYFGEDGGQNRNHPRDEFENVQRPRKSPLTHEATDYGHNQNHDAGLDDYFYD